MTITVKHKFVSTIPDSTNTALVRPTNWNDTHDLVGLGTMAEQNANAVAITGGTISNTTFTSDTVSNNLAFTPTAAPSYLEGDLWYDSTAKALTYYNDSSALAVHIGQDLIIKVINNTGSTIANGSPVYVTSTSSGQTYPNVALAKADVAATSSVLGLTNGAIPNGSIGYVTAQGGIDGVNTSTYTVGQILYLSPYSAGQLMNTVPPTGITVQVGIVTYVNASGKIYVKQTIPLSLVSTFSAGTTGFTPSTATSGAITLGGTLVIANGGTNGSAAPTAGTVAYGTGTAYAFTSAGTSGQVLVSNGASAPSWANTSSTTALTIVDDTTSGTTYKLAMTTATSGTINTEYVDSAELTFKTGVGHGSYTAQGLQAPSARFNGYLALAETPTTTNVFAFEVYDTLGTMTLYSPNSGTPAENIVFGPKGWLTIGSDGNLNYPSIAPLYVAGPNNAPQIIINANNTQTHGLEINYDASNNALLNNYNSANLAFGTNNTTKVTINTTGALGFGSTPSYGTSNQVLISNGTGASPSWTNASSVSGNISITNDNTSNTNYNLTFTTASSGTITGEYVNNSKLYYNPSLQMLYTPNLTVSVPTGSESYLYFRNTSTGVEKANINVYDNFYGNGRGYFEIYVTDGTTPQYANLNFNGYGAFGFDDNFGNAGQVLISAGSNGKTAWGNISGGTF